MFLNFTQISKSKSPLSTTVTWHFILAISTWFYEVFSPTRRMAFQQAKSSLRRRGLETTRFLSCLWKRLRKFFLIKGFRIEVYEAWRAQMTKMLSSKESQVLRLLSPCQPARWTAKGQPSRQTETILGRNLTQKQSCFRTCLLSPGSSLKSIFFWEIRWVPQFGIFHSFGKFKCIKNKTQRFLRGSWRTCMKKKNKTECSYFNISRKSSVWNVSQIEEIVHVNFIQSL